MEKVEPINTNRGDYVRPNRDAGLYVARAYGKIHVVARNLRGPNLRLAHSKNEKIKVGLYCGKVVKSRIYESSIAEWDQMAEETQSRRIVGRVLKAKYVLDDEATPSTAACLECDRQFNQSEIAL